MNGDVASPIEGLSGPLVSIVMPVRNEVEHIDRALDAIDAQTFERKRIEIIVVDGGSDDGTVERVRLRAKDDHRIRLVGGKGINTPRAMNIGAGESSGAFVAKVDGHGWINSQFLAVAVSSLTSDPTLACVGGRIVPVATTAAQHAMGLARFSMLGVGPGVYTLAERRQLTDTVQCGVYRREALAAVVGFDPELPFGEDEEVNYRLRVAGWHILMDPEMRFSYHVRPTLQALLSQYFRYGRARAAVVRKHPAFFHPKHALPGLLVMILGASLFLGAAIRSIRLPMMVWGGYLAVLGLGGCWLAVKHGFRRPDLIAASLAALHVGYGAGTIRGLWDATKSRRT